MKKAYFFIDDVIWSLRELTQKRPESLLEVPFFNVLKTAHDKYGVKTQLNLFYRTSSFYGYDEFTLEDVTDAYKDEFTKASDCLKFSFHAKEEFPDLPHVNTSYENAKRLFLDTQKQVFRFAGENSFSYTVTPHWDAISKEGTRALRDCGVRVLDCTYGGEAYDYNGNPRSYPYTISAALANNNQHETKHHVRKSAATGEEFHSICSYNHLTQEQADLIMGKLAYHYDEELDMYFKPLASGVIRLDATPCEELDGKYTACIQNECVITMTHEQYFYEDYFNYQPDYADKIYKMGKIMSENGYEFFFPHEDLK